MGTGVGTYLAVTVGVHPLDHGLDVFLLHALLRQVPPELAVPEPNATS